MLYVSNKNSIILGSTTLDPGSPLPAEHGLTEARIKEFLKQGHLVNYDPSKVDPDDVPHGARIAPVRTAVKWPYDPDGLRGKSLEELNEMVANIDPKIPAFDTATEALAQLSMDFVEVKDII